MDYAVRYILRSSFQIYANIINKRRVFFFLFAGGKDEINGQQRLG